MTTTTYGQPAATVEPSRPLGAAILAVLIGIVGFLYAVAGALVAALGGLGYFDIHNFLPISVSYSTLVIGIVILIIGLIILGVAVGLWDQRLWALVLAIIFFGAIFVTDVIAGNLLSLGAIISLLLVIYLIAVHRHFT